VSEFPRVKKDNALSDYCQSSVDKAPDKEEESNKCIAQQDD